MVEAEEEAATWGTEFSALVVGSSAPWAGDDIHGGGVLALGDG